MIRGWTSHILLSCHVPFHPSSLSAQLVGASLLQSLVLALPASIEERQSTSCAPLIHFHAAGTSENGLGIVGNALARDLPKAVPGAVVRAINYDTRAE